MLVLRAFPLLIFAALALPATAAAQCDVTDLDMDGVPDVCPAGSNYIAGTEGADFLFGSNGDDCIFAFGGDDFILGRGGNDYICAGDGGDMVFGGNGGDQVFGEGGDDFISSGNGDDIVNGGDGGDTLFGGGGDDSISGGDGNDNINGGGGDDALSGGDGEDSVNGGGGTNTCVDEATGVDNCATITYAAVSAFELVRTSQGLAVTWSTSAEVGTVAFRVWRFESDESLTWVGEVSASPEGSPHGADYVLYDETAPAGGALEYLIEERTVSGSSVRYGPFVRSQASGRLQSALRSTARRRARIPHSVSLQPLRRPRVARMEQSLSRKAMAVPEGARLTIDTAGVIDVDAAAIAGALQISAAAVSERIRSGGLHLELGGESIAWHSVDGGSALRFVSHEVVTPFSNVRRYLVSVADGVIMEERTLETASATEPHTFVATARFEENLFAGVSGSPDPRQDLFFWHALASEAEVSIPVSLAAGSESSAEALRVYVHAATAHADQPHRVSLEWNGQSLGVFDFLGRERHTISVSLDGMPAGVENEVVVAQQVAGEAPPVLYVDAVEVDYRRFAESDGTSFRFGGADTAEQSVTGLQTGTVSLYDVTEPSAPEYYGDVSVDLTGRLSFDSDETGRRYLIASPEAVSSPVEVAPHFGSTLRSTDHDVDYLIVAASHLMADARALADLREADGYRVLLVDVDEVYWAFADGEPDPLAIRELLSFAWQNWSTAPRFAALVGKGTLDYRDIMGLGGNWLPPALAVTDGGAFPSDSILGDVLGNDGVPEIAIGRFPVTSGEELARAVSAIENFEATHELGSALFAADDSDASEFAAAAGGLTAWTSPDWSLDIDLNVETLQDARDRLMFSWGGSLSWLSYVGHGGLDRIAAEGLLTSADVPALAELPSTPVVLGWTCNMVRFDIPGFISLGEQLVTEGTSAGVFSATGWSDHGRSDDLRAAFSALVFNSDAETIGDAMIWAHQAASEAPLAVHRVYALLGDPALRLRAPKSQPEPDPVPEPEPNPNPGPSDGGNDPVGAPRNADNAPNGASGCAIAHSDSDGAPLELGLMLLASMAVARRRRFSRNSG